MEAGGVGGRLEERHGAVTVAVVTCKVCGRDRPLFATNEGSKPLGGVFAVDGRRAPFRYCNDNEACVRDACRLMGVEQ